MDHGKLKNYAKKKKLEDFKAKFRKGFSGKSKASGKMRTETTGQKLMKLFKGN